jgi:hypothetical protein
LAGNCGGVFQRCPIDSGNQTGSITNAITRKTRHPIFGHGYPCSSHKIAKSAKGNSLLNPARLTDSKNRKAGITGNRAITGQRNFERTFSIHKKIARTKIRPFVADRRHWLMPYLKVTFVENTSAPRLMVTK